MTLFALTTSREQAEERNRFAIVAETAIKLVDHEIGVRIAILRAMQDLVERKTIRDADDFRSQAASYIDHFPGFVAINRIDAARTIAIVVPYEGNANALGRRVGATPEVIALLDAAQAAHTPEATRLTRLFQGGTGVATYFPLVVDGQFAGYVNGVLNLGEIQHAIAQGLNPALQIELQEDGDAGPSPDTAATAQFERRQAIHVLNRVWTVDVRLANDAKAVWLDPSTWESAIGVLLSLALALFMLLNLRERGRIARREALLRESREHLAQAQRVAKMGSIKVDLPSGRVTWSDAQFTLLGVDPSNGQLRAEEYYQLVHPDDRGKLREALAQARLGLEFPPFQYRLVAPNGTVRWIERQAQLMRDGRGAVTHVIVTHHDITGSKAADERLRRSQEHLQLAQRVGGIGSAEIDLATGADEWSDELYRILGVERGEVEPAFATFLDFVHPDDRAEMQGIRSRTVAGAIEQPSEYRIVRRDGAVRWIHRQGERILDASGAHVRTIVTLHDITDRKRLEDELRRKEEHLARALAIGRIGSAEVDFITGKMSWSDGLYAMLGLDPATTEPTFENHLRVVHPEDRAAMVDARQRDWSGDPARPLDVRVVRPDGEVRWTLRQSEIARAPDGKPLRLTVTFQDITERKRAEIERDEIARQLMQSQKMEAIGKLTGGMAHDFNNLLSVIMGRLEMLRDELADRPQLRDWVRTCLNAAARGATLTRSMLAFSRQQPLKPVKLDLASAFADMLELLPRTLGETIEVKVQFGAGLWTCEADPAQLQNALLNLALNARDAMPQGGKLTIEAVNVRLDPDYAARNLVAPGEYVALSVSDTGTGMPPEVVARAFDPFFTTKGVGKGTGLGLSMVYGFAKQSGGHVMIYSEVGIGTTVRLYLPRSTATSAAPETAAADRLPPAGGEAILIVEDDADMRALTAAQLERLGYRPLAATTAAEALDLLAAHPEIRLLLTDLTLPGGVNGRTLAERAVAAAPGLRVLYMSGYTENAVIHQGRLDAHVRLLQKPFGIDDLARQVREALDRD